MNIDPARGPSKAPSSSGTRRRIPRVLIVEDESDFRAPLQEALAESCQVIAVSEANDALARLLAGERYDLVLCDVMMPSVDGIEFHRRLAATMPEQADRVVFMSGGAFIVRVESFFSRVPNLLLTKPLDLEGLRALIERRMGDSTIPVRTTDGS